MNSELKIGGEAGNALGHTATPWFAVPNGEHQWRIVVEDPNSLHCIAITLQGNDEANSKFIVRAVNSHEALVAALEASGLTADEAIADTLDQIHNGQCGTGPGLMFLATELRARTEKRRAALQLAKG